MNWKSITLQALLFAVFLYLGVKLVGPADPSKMEGALAALSDQYKQLKSHLDEVDKKLAVLAKDLEQTVKVAEMRRRHIEESKSAAPPPEGEFRTRTAMPAPPSPNTPPGRPDRFQAPPRGPSPLWLDQLSPEKRTKVLDAFMRHAQALRDTMPSTGGDTHPDPEAMRSTLESQEEAFRSELQGILSPEEYASFTKSLPGSSPVRPGSQGKQTNNQEKGGWRWHTGTS